MRSRYLDIAIQKILFVLEIKLVKTDFILMIDVISVVHQAPRGAPVFVSQVDYPIKIDYNEEKIINKNILII